MRQRNQGNGFACRWRWWSRAPDGADPGAHISMPHSSTPTHHVSSGRPDSTSLTSATRACGRSWRTGARDRRWTAAAQSAVSDAIAAYEAGRYDDTERGFVRARRCRRTIQPRSLACTRRTGSRDRIADAEQAFAELVAASLDAGSLSVKLLFKVGATAFVD